MRRLLPLVMILLTGCGTDPEPTVPRPAADGEQSAEIDFARWPTATPEPIPVDMATALACAHMSSNEAHEAKKQIHGPHLAWSIVVRVNPDAIDLFKSHKPLPVGTTIIKEKHFDVGATSALKEYAAMIKREAGYDSAHGDWEYQYVVRGKPVTITRGKLGACIDCHEGKKDQDYLFRTYLPKTPPAQNRIK